jgi:hypothetical protein
MDHALRIKLRQIFLSVLNSKFCLVSHKNSYRVSKFLSTVIMRSSSWFGLKRLKFLSLQFLSLSAHICHITSRLSQFSPHYVIVQILPSPPYRLFSISYSWINYTSRYIYKYVPWYHAQFRSRCIQQSMNQFSNTQRSVPTVAHDELWWSSVSIKLPHVLILHITKAKCGLSAAAAVCVHLAECAEGVGRIDNSAVGAGLSYLMNRATVRNVWNA